MFKKQNQHLWIFLSLFFIFLVSPSCNKAECPSDWNCDSAAYHDMDLRIEGYIDKNNFKASNVAYCDHNPKSDNDKLKQVAKNLKARLHYEEDNKPRFETDLIQTQSGNPKEREFLVNISLLYPFSDLMTIKIVRLNDKGEEIHVLGEIKFKDLPQQPKRTPPYDCKKIPLF